MANLANFAEAAIASIRAFRSRHGDCSARLAMKTQIALCTLILAGCAAAEEPTNPVAIHRTIQAAAAGRPAVIGRRQSTAAVSTGNGIDYHGGAIMTSPATVYFIWYGNWLQAPALTILPDLIRHLGGSYYYNINNTYGVPNALIWGGSVFDNTYSQGYGTLSGGDIKSIVERAIDNGSLPANPNAIYLVLTSADINQNLAWGLEGSFCSDYCGWHTHDTINGQTLHYGFIGNPTRCPDKCAQYTNGPNGDLASDAMASVIAHEIEETATDPNDDGWKDSNGKENADKCAWTFGATYRAPNGTWANMHLGSRDYLIQQNWVNAEGGFCATQYTGLTTEVLLAGTGYVSSSPSGITNCGGTCEHGFTPGSTVTLTATPRAGYVFRYWQGCDSVTTTGQCRMTMSGNRGVIAYFGCATTLDQACYNDCMADCPELKSACIPECRLECGGC